MLEFKLLPKQKDFIHSKRNTLFVAGYGSGKSYAGTVKTIIKKLMYPNQNVAYYLPTYGLIRDIAFDKFPTILDELKLKYKLNKSDKEIHIENYGNIIFRSMDTPETIVGYEVAYSLIDEADILPMSKMDKVYKKILGRNRAVENANVDAVSTPEGYKWLYQQSLNGHFEVIRAKTNENKFLAKDYIHQLQEQYPEALLKAYLDGEFVNLSTGTIFNYFKREIHHTDIVDDNSSEILISQDFNIGGCVSCVYIRVGQSIVQINEFESYDTKDIIANTKRLYSNRVVSFYPDASGNAKKTSASQTDIQMIKQAGFKVYVNGRNPSVKDRINITNNCFDKNMVKINTVLCPRTTKAFEQHSYKENGEPEKLSGAGTVDDYTDAATYVMAFLFPIVRNGVSRQELSFS